MTAVNAVIALIGPEKIDDFGRFASRPGWIYLPFRYLLLPIVAVFVLDQPDGVHNGSFPARKIQTGIL